MKIAFITSIQALPPYKEYYRIIVNYLIKQGNNVYHLLSLTEEMITKLSPDKQSTIFNKFYKDIRDSDLVIAEVSFPSVNIGYEICHAIQHKKDVIILQSIEPGLPFTSNLLYTDKNTYLYKYTKQTLIHTLQKALQYTPPKKYEKYNILLSPEIIHQLSLISKKKNLPKSVFIRQIIENSLKTEQQA